MEPHVETLANLLVESAKSRETLTYGTLSRRLQKRTGKLIPPIGMGRPLEHVHNAVRDAAASIGIVAPPLTVIVENGQAEEPGRGMSPLLQEWLEQTDAAARMREDVADAVRRDAAAPPHAVRYAQSKVFEFGEWDQVVGAIPE